MDQPIPPEPTAWPPRRVALATLAVFLIIGAFWIFFTFRVVLFSLFTAIVLSTAIEPLLEFLRRRGVSRTVSVVVVSLVVLLALVALVITIAPLISEQWATITSLVTGWYEQLRETLVTSPSLLVRRLGRQLPRNLPLTLPAPELEAVPGGESPDIVAQAMNTATAVLRGIFIVIAVMLMSSLWSLEGERATRFLLLSFPQKHRESVRNFWNEIEEKVGSYTRGLVILCLIIGVLQLIAYLIIGLPNALLLGILAGFMEAIPLVGPVLGAVPAVIVAAALDPSKLTWVIIATLIIQALENNLIVPRVMSRAVGVNPVASLLAFIAFGSIFGFVGALLAIPLAAVVQLILNRLVFNRNEAEAAPPVGRDAISTLRYEAQGLAQDVRKQVRHKEGELDQHTDQVEDAMEAAIQDLDSILAQVERQRNRRQPPDQPSAQGSLP